MLLEWIILLMLGFMFSILRDNKEVVYAQLDKIRFTNKEIYNNKDICNNKYEKESGLRFEPLDDDDSIQDFQFEKKEVQVTLRDIDSPLERKVTMDTQMLTTPKLIETELEGCPPIIARHFFGRDYVDSFTI